jgi:hypothetical protein
MSSACEGDAIAASVIKKRRLRHRATRTFVISAYRAPDRGASNHRSIHLDEERVAIVTDDAA